MDRDDFFLWTGLPNDRPFDLEPWRNPVDGRWLMKVKAKGLVDSHMHPGHIIAYVDELRKSDLALAEKIAGAIAAWREASETH